MSLKARIRTELDRLISTAGAAGGATPVEWDIDKGSLQIGFTAVDQLACSFDACHVATEAFAGATIEQLQEVARALSAQLSYLLERISPIEIDREACIVQMRSNPPERDDDGSKYYELVVSRQGIHLWRYAKVVGQRRQVIAATVTREVFARLASDLAGAIA